MTKKKGDGVGTAYFSRPPTHVGCSVTASFMVVLQRVVRALWKHAEVDYFGDGTVVIATSTLLGLISRWMIPF
jgi:hypothetical protein